MEILQSKEIILEEINKIINTYHSNQNKHTLEMKLFTEEVQRLNKLNQNLSSEISSKDKLLCINEQKMIDYENMINKIQEDALKETTEKERFDMLKAQDKEIHLRDQEILRLQKKIDNLENKEIEEIDEEFWKKESRNTFINDPEKVKISVQGYSKHTGLSENVESVGKSSLGINGWYNDTNKPKSKTLTEKMKDITFKNEAIIENIQEVETEVIEEVQENKPTEVIEEVQENKPTEVIEEDTSEDTSEDELEVEIITHYKKEYYIKSNEKNPQYIYSINDGDIGSIVGELQGKKKIFYPKEG